MSRARASLDPALVAAQERLLEAVARDWRRKVTYAVRHRRLSPERLALILTGIAAELLDKGARFAAAPAVAEDE